MTVEQLRAEYSTYIAGRAEWGCTTGANASMRQIMESVPKLLDLMEAAIEWRNRVDGDNDMWELSDAIERLTS